MPAHMNPPAWGPFVGTSFMGSMRCARVAPDLLSTESMLRRAPSRASMLTGYSPWVHGVTQTDGFAKRYDDPAQIWLRPNKVPTLGHRFKAAGWETVYLGKWHLSHADIEPISGETWTEAHRRYSTLNRSCPTDLTVGLDPSLMALTLGMPVSIATMSTCLRLRAFCAAVLRRVMPNLFCW